MELWVIIMAKGYCRNCGIKIPPSIAGQHPKPLSAYCVFCWKKAGRETEKLWKGSLWDMAKTKKARRSIR